MRVSRRRCDDRSRGWNDEKKGPGAKKHMQPLTIENGMEIILHEASRRNIPANTSILAQGHLCWTLNHRTVR